MTIQFLLSINQSYVCCICNINYILAFVYVILLHVLYRSGKSSIHKVVFQKMCAAETCHLPTTYRIVKDCE